MPIVNYVREIERFIEYAADKRLTANERCLWYGLMHIFNQKANGNDWPGDFIPIINDRVFTYCPGGFDTLARCRNRLKQLGLIDFRNGNRNKAAPEYRMIYQCLEDCHDGADKRVCYPQNTDNTGDNVLGNIVDNTRDNTRDKTGDILINTNKERYTQTRTVYDEEDDEEEAIRAGACEDDAVTDRPDRENEIVGAYRRAIGRNPYTAEVNKLVWAGYARKMAPAMAARAVAIAAEEGAAKPCQYAVKIMDEWEAAHVLQPEQIDGFRLEEKIRLGKAPFAGTGDGAEDWRRRQEAAEARRQENIRAGLETDWMAKEG